MCITIHSAPHSVIFYRFLLLSPLRPNIFLGSLFTHNLRHFFYFNMKSNIQMSNEQKALHSLTKCLSYSWKKERDQLDVTCFIISLFNAQHVSDVNTSIFWSLRLICWVISWVVLLWYDACWCYVVVWLEWCCIRMQAEAVLQPAVLVAKLT